MSFVGILIELNHVGNFFGIRILVKNRTQIGHQIIYRIFNDVFINRFINPFNVFSSRFRHYFIDSLNDSFRVIFNRVSHSHRFRTGSNFFSYFSNLNIFFEFYFLFGRCFDCFSGRYCCGFCRNYRNIAWSNVRFSSSFRRSLNFGFSSFFNYSL